MARDLSDLFGSVQDLPPGASSSTAPVPSSGFSGKSGVGGGGGGSVYIDSFYCIVYDVFYVY